MGSLRLFVGWKTALTGLLVATPLLLDHLPHYHKHAKYFTRTMHPIPRPLFHWDGEHYMLLATRGYDGVETMTQAFYPLLPLLIRGLAVLVRSPTAAAILVTTAIAFAMVAIYVRHFDDGNSRGTIAAALLLCHPVGFFLGVVYTEALFLALLVGFLHLRERGHWGALACAAALPLCRGQGLLVGATMLGVAVLKMILERRIDRAALRRATTEAAAFGLGFGALLGYTYLATGNAWNLFEAQQAFVFNNSVANILNPGQTWSFLTRVPDNAFAYTNAWFDKAFVGIALVLLYFARRADLTRACLAVVLTVVPILMGEGGSYARFSLLAFALLAPEIADALRPRRVLLGAVLFVCAAAQAYLAGRFALNLWVS